MRGDCWGTWLIMLGFMDLGWPRVCRCSCQESVLISQWKVLIVSFTLDFQRISIHITMERFDCQFYIRFSKNQYSYHNGKVWLSVLHWIFKESVFISQWKGSIVSFTLDFQRISIHITMERFDCQFYIGFSKNQYSYHNGKVWLSVLHWIFKD